MSRHTDGFEEMERFIKENKASRQISRNAIYRIVLLSSAIVGFSVSLFSIQSLQSSLDIELVRFSWYAFVIVIILGCLILLMEGRMRFAINWKGNQTSTYLDYPSEYSGKEKWFAFLIVIWTIIYPANLTFNRIYSSEDEKEFKTKVNGLAVHWLARLNHKVSLFENLTFLFFITGLIILIKSFIIPI